MAAVAVALKKNLNLGPWAMAVMVLLDKNLNLEPWAMGNKNLNAAQEEEVVVGVAVASLEILDLDSFPYLGSWVVSWVSSLVVVVVVVVVGWVVVETLPQRPLLRAGCCDGRFPLPRLVLQYLLQLLPANPARSCLQPLTPPPLMPLTTCKRSEQTQTELELDACLVAGRDGHCFHSCACSLLKYPGGDTHSEFLRNVYQNCGEWGLPFEH